MSGHKSRRRGKRGEYLLRDYLRQRGWVADRVPTSGAAQGFKGDVKATKYGKTLLFEVKNHSNAFKSIYALYDEHTKLAQDDLLSFVCPNEAKLCVGISTSLDAVLDGPDVYEFQDRNPLNEKYKRTFKKIAGMQKLLGESDILVLKDNHKPFLFIRYL